MSRPFFLLAALVALAPASAAAGDRYGNAPPLVVSPDLSAPWVMQLQRVPVGIARAPAGVAYRPRHMDAAQQGLPDPREPGRATYAPRKTKSGYYVPATREFHADMNPAFLPQDVDYDGKQKPGTIVIDTRQNFLFLVEGGGKARRYGVGTGKPGFEWSGTHKVTAKRQWPDWTPPPEMIVRERAKGRILPSHMAGGPENPLGARALYLGSTQYRIHGTNQPWTIGGAVSSGCIRMRNEDVVDLYERVKVGARVQVI